MSSSSGIRVPVRVRHSRRGVRAFVRSPHAHAAAADGPSNNVQPAPDISSWTPPQVVEALSSILDDPTRAIFLANDVTGLFLPRLSDASLLQMGIASWGKRQRILDHISQWTEGMEEPWDSDDLDDPNITDSYHRDATSLQANQLSVIPIFNGNPGEKISVFLDAMRDAATLFHWSDEQFRGVLTLKLQTKAKAYYESLDSSMKNDRLRVIGALNSHFGVHEKAQADADEFRLENIRQGPAEDLQTYVDRVRELCFKVNPNMSDRDKVIHLKRGLKGYLKAKAIEHNTYFKDSFESAIEHLRDFELSISMNQQQRKFHGSDNDKGFKRKHRGKSRHNKEKTDQSPGDRSLFTKSSGGYRDFKSKRPEEDRKGSSMFKSNSSKPSFNTITAVSDSEIEDPFESISMDPSQRRSILKRNAHINTITEVVMVHTEDSSTGGSLPYVSIPINDQHEVLALIDTGASRSVVNHDLIVHFQLEHKLTHSDTILKGVTENQLEVVGEIALCLNINETKLTGTFVVVNDLPFDLVIGCPEIIRNDIQIDLSDGFVTMNGVQLKLTYREMNNPISINTAYDSIQPLLNKFRHRFGDPVGGYGQATVPPHVMEVDPKKEHKTFAMRKYRRSPKEDQIIDEYVDQMIQLGVVEPSMDITYCSPPVLASKKGTNEKRFCINYMKLNESLKDLPFPAPDRQNIINSLHGSTIFSKIDLIKFYWQLPLHEASRPLTTFATRRGSFQGKCVMFGEKNAPSYAQRTILSVLGNLIGVCCYAYIDDILVFSPTMEQHVRDLERVLTCLETANLYLNEKKCVWGVEHTDFLGFHISKDGISPLESTVSAINNYPVPHGLKDLRSFLGAVNFLRDTIPNCATIMEPLTRLLKKGTKFIWGPEQQQSFDSLKRILTHRPVLSYPDFTKPFDLVTDASNIGIAGILQQDGHPIAYVSRRLTPAEANYSTTDKELLAIKWCVFRLQYLIRGQHVEVFTDHRPLVGIMDRIHLHQGKLQRWLEYLLEFDININYLPGNSNGLADALSRHYINSMRHELSDVSEWLSSYADDDLAKDIKNGKQITGYMIHSNGLIYYKDRKSRERLYVPSARRQYVMGTCHGHILAGHPGTSKMYRQLSGSYFWPKMYQDIRTYVINCVSCGLWKKGHHIRHSGHIPTDYPKLECWSMDILGPLPQTRQKHRYVLALIDHKTRWLVCYPMSTISADKIAQVMMTQFIPQYGIPKILHSDQGSNLVKGVMKELVTLLNITSTTSTTYHPEGNALIERANGVILNGIRTLLKSDGLWHETLPFVLMHYRQSYHSSIRCSPYEALYGVSPNMAHLPMATFTKSKMLSTNLDRFNHASRVIQSSIEDCPFEVGTMVWILKPHHNKLEPLYEGPYRITKIHSKQDVIVDIEGDPIRVNVTKLKAAGGAFL